MVTAGLQQVPSAVQVDSQRQVEVALTVSADDRGQVEDRGPARHRAAGRSRGGRRCHHRSPPHLRESLSVGRTRRTGRTTRSARSPAALGVGQGALGQESLRQAGAQEPGTTGDHDSHLLRPSGLLRPYATNALPSPAAVEPHFVGTFFSMSANHTAALPSEGARQSPRGLREPPSDTFGPFGIADRLNWRTRRTASRRRPTTRGCRRVVLPSPLIGNAGGQTPVIDVPPGVVRQEGDLGRSERRSAACRTG